MAKVRVTYDEHRKWGYPKNRDNRPYTEIELVGPSGSVRIWALIDTGADTIQLDENFATQVGLYPANNGTQTSVQTAGGAPVQLYELSNVEIIIEGRTIFEDCLFSAPNSNDHLLGRNTFLAAMDVGLDLRGWLFK